MKKKPTKVSLKRLSNIDDWSNTLTGLGQSNRDKQTSSTARSNVLDYGQALELYRGSDTARTLVDVIAGEMTREWFDVRIPDGEEQAEQIGAQLDDLNAPSVITDAIQKQRAFGGAAVLMGVNDGVGDPALPVNEGKIKSIDFLTVFDPSEVWVNEWVSNPADPKFGQPQSYTFAPQVLGVQTGNVLNNVHASRVLRFCGPALSRKQLNINRGWGDSVFDLTHTVIRDFETAYSNSSALLGDFAQAVFKIKGLAQAIASDNASLVKNRLVMMDFSRSVLRAIAIDADGEDFERKPTPLSGLPELLDRFANRLAAAARMPVTVLMGQAPAGLNATGDADLQNFFAHVSRLQKRELIPQLEVLVRYLFLVKGGKGEPKNWSIVPRPLYQESEGEQAITRNTMAQADMAYITNGVLTPSEVRESRFGGDRYSVDTVLENVDTSPATEALNETEGTPRIDPETGEPAQVMPGMPAPTSGGAPSKQDTALNGAQVTSAVDIVARVHKGELPREGGVAMLMNFFQLTSEKAEAIMGPENFEPEPSLADQVALAKAENPAPAAPGMPGQPGKPPAKPVAKPGFKPNGDSKQVSKSYDVSKLTLRGKKK